MTARRYVLVLPAMISETIVDGTKREHAIRIECAVMAEDVKDAARIVAEAVHIGLVRASYEPADDGQRADLLTLPVKATESWEREALARVFAHVPSPRRAVPKART